MDGEKCFQAGKDSMANHSRQENDIGREQANFVANRGEADLVQLKRGAENRTGKATQYRVAAISRVTVIDPTREIVRQFGPKQLDQNPAFVGTPTVSFFRCGYCQIDLDTIQGRQNAPFREDTLGHSFQQNVRRQAIFMQQQGMKEMT